MLSQRNLAISTLILGFFSLCYVTFYWMQQLYPIRAPLKIFKDLYLYDVEYQKFDTQGELKEHLFAEQMEHSVADHNYRFKQPKMQVKFNGRVVWDIVANFAQKNELTSTIVLWDQVKILHQGQVAQRAEMYADRVEYFLRDNHYVFDRPRTVFWDNQGIKWRILAKKGETVKNNQMIHLRGSVVIERLIANQPLKISTEELAFYPLTRRAVTTKSVKILEGESEINALGAKLNLDKGALELLSNTKILYQFE